MLDVGAIDVEEIATALADQWDAEHRWLLDPRTGPGGVVDQRDRYRWQEPRRDSRSAHLPRDISGICRSVLSVVEGA